MNGGLTEEMNGVSGLTLALLFGEECPSRHEMGVVRGRETRVPGKDGTLVCGVSLWSLPEGEGVQEESEGRHRACGSLGKWKG